MSNRSDNFHHAVQTANVWLADVAREFGTDDRRFAYRVLRAWLHTFRDRLTVDSAAKFTAQLPALLRGVFYDGWEPSKVPARYGVDEYVERFAREARISPDQVRSAAAAVASALIRHLSPGQLAEAGAQLPAPLRTLIVGPPPRPAAPPPTPPPPTPPPAAAGRTAHTTEQRLATLEAQLSSVTEALRTLALGLEGTPMAGVRDRQGSRAARLAAEMLMAAAPEPVPEPVPER
jgi:uncharacterized protein (DUF2267 family)